MAGNGYIKIHRKMKDWGWYKDPSTFRVFIHLLLSASYKEEDYRGHHIMPGQVVCGRKQLAKDLGLSERTIRTALNHLKSTNEITIKTTNKFSIITIEKWGKYQLQGNTNDQQNDQQAVQRPTSKTTKSDHIQELKKLKNIEGVPPPPTFEEIKEYVTQMGYEMDPAAFFDYYEETGWLKKNGQPIRDWRASVRTWNRREREFQKTDIVGKPVIEPPKYKEFEPDPVIDAVEMPESVRAAADRYLK